MQSLGVKLRLERERQGLTIDNIATETRISHRYLESIEADDQSSLPGPFFYRAFIRQYSKYLGWDPDEIEKQINLVSSIPIAEPIQAPAPTNSSLSLVHDSQINALREKLKVAPLQPSQQEGISRAWLAFALLVILASASYFALRNFTPAPDVVAKSEEQPAATQQPAAPTPETQLPPVQQAAKTPEPPPVEDSKASEVQPGKFSLTVRAKETTWIRLTADGTKIHGGTLDPGQERTVNASAVELLVGNCGTLDVIYNGKLLSYGSKGEVKTLLMGPEGWKFKPKPLPEATASPTGSTTGNAATGSLSPRAL